MADGICGREPVAIITSSPVMMSSPVLIVLGPMNSACWSYTVIFGVSSPRRYASPPSAILSMRLVNTRSTMESQSTWLTHLGCPGSGNWEAGKQPPPHTPTFWLGCSQQSCKCRPILLFQLLLLKLHRD